jgi:hypothetical protein
MHIRLSVGFVLVRKLVYKTIPLNGTGLLILTRPEPQLARSA